MVLFRYFFHVIILSLVALCCWYTYDYFFDMTMPQLSFIGIDDCSYYSGDISCSLLSDKTGFVTVSVDSQLLLNTTKVKARQQTFLVVLPTKSLTNGKHVMRTEFFDTTYHKNYSFIEHEFYVDNQPLQAVFVKTGSPYRVFQGRTLHIQFQVNKEIKKALIQLLSFSYECHPETKNSYVYECFIPMQCEEQPNEYLFSVDIEDHVGNTIRLDNKFQIVAYPFKKEVLTVTADKVKEEKSLGRDGKDLEDEIIKLLDNSPHEKLWRGVFCAPIEIQRITCEYGTIRTTQHKGRYAHKAIDVVNMPKSVVWAPQDGIIVLKDRFAPSGNTVIIDHGLGIFSLLYHLDSFADIEIGQKIIQGNPIGTIGKTGFATGYHLHWEMRIHNIPVDPLQWIKPSL